MTPRKPRPIWACVNDAGEVVYHDTRRLEADLAAIQFGQRVVRYVPSSPHARLEAAVVKAAEAWLYEVERSASPSSFGPVRMIHDAVMALRRAREAR